MRVTKFPKVSSKEIKWCKGVLACLQAEPCMMQGLDYLLDITHDDRPVVIHHFNWDWYNFGDTGGHLMWA